jgi:hypothetical protein
MIHENREELGGFWKELRLQPDFQRAFLKRIII